MNNCTSTGSVLIGSVNVTLYYIWIYKEYVTEKKLILVEKIKIGYKFFSYFTMTYFCVLDKQLSTKKTN